MEQGAEVISVEVRAVARVQAIMDTAVMQLAPLLVISSKGFIITEVTQMASRILLIK